MGVPLLLAASEEVKSRYLAPVARGEAMFSYALSEPEAGSDAAAMRTKAVRSDAGYVLNGVKRWITNAGVSKYYTVMAVTDPAAGANGISAFVLEDGDEGFSACKCLASDVAMQVTTDAVQLLGGYGYVNDYPVERMMRDAKITQIYEGTNQIQRMVMARQLLK